jgi:hypothetical protein
LLTVLLRLVLRKLIEHENRFDFGMTVGMLTIVVVFYLCTISLQDSNTLTGRIPSEIGLMTSLKDLYLGKLIE